jgi:hypothetical protein
VTGASAWCQRTENSLTDYIGEHAQERRLLEARIDGLVARELAFQTLTVGQRLRWLLTGVLPQSIEPVRTLATPQVSEKATHRSHSGPYVSPNAVHRPIP